MLHFELEASITLTENWTLLVHPNSACCLTQNNGTIAPNDKALNLINRPKMVYNIFIKSNISLAACRKSVIKRAQTLVLIHTGDEWREKEKWLCVTCSEFPHVFVAIVDSFFRLFLFFFCNHINHPRRRRRRRADWISPTILSQWVHRNRRIAHKQNECV